MTNAIILNCVVDSATDDSGVTTAVVDGTGSPGAAATPESNTVVVSIATGVSGCGVQEFDSADEWNVVHCGDVVPLGGAVVVVKVCDSLIGRNDNHLVDSVSPGIDDAEGVLTIQERGLDVGF